jgi:type IV fimbrial biogenesis protein FimT
LEQRQLRLGYEERRLVLMQKYRGVAARGFTIVELMVALTIVGIVMTVGTPLIATMIQNSKLSSATKSYAVGIQTARTEAIRMNRPVDFVLTDSSVAAGVSGSANGKNWIVRWSDSGTPTLVEGKSIADGAGQQGANSVTIVGAVTAPTGGSFSGVLTFNGFGAVNSGETVALDIRNPAGGACADANGPMRCQRIQVRPGGQINVCDPKAAAGDSRYCQP